jgi:hypothetical protein
LTASSREEEAVPAVDQRPGHPRTAIVVSGMHRSGTSAITRVLSLLGAGLPRDIIEGRRDNERGFWEGRAVVDLDESALVANDTWWGGWQEVDAGRLLESESLVKDARHLIREEFADGGLLVLKDPRVSRLLPLWKRAFDDEGFRCVHVVALRHPGAVAGSIGRRNLLSPEVSTLSWLAHTLDAEQHTRGEPRVLVSFENLLRDWRREMDRVSQALDVEWPEDADEAGDAVNEFIEPGLAHETPNEASGPVASIAPLYDVLRRWAADDTRSGDEATLESWRDILAPLRTPRSAVAVVARERLRVIDEVRARGKWPGQFANAKQWYPIQNQALNAEAESAWAWLLRELQHAGSLAAGPQQEA